MTGSTVNIADFRCRAIRARVGRNSSASSERPHGFAVVESAVADRALMLQEAMTQENPTVYDIGIAREAQRMRPRALFRPICIQRRAKVLRFTNNAPVQMMRADAARATKGVPEYSGGPYDFPPAA